MNEYLFQLDASGGIQRAIIPFRVNIFQEFILLWHRDKLRFQIYMKLWAKLMITWGKCHYFLSPLGLLKFHMFFNFLIHVQAALLKTLLEQLASTSNIREVMKFYKLGDNSTC